MRLREGSATKDGTQVAEVRTENPASHGTLSKCFLLLTPAQGTDPKKCRDIKKNNPFGAQLLERSKRAQKIGESFTLPQRPHGDPRD